LRLQVKDGHKDQGNEPQANDDFKKRETVILLV
jgi:hypothetical protein